MKKLQVFNLTLGIAMILLAVFNAGYTLGGIDEMEKRTKEDREEATRLKKFSAELKAKADKAAKEILASAPPIVWSTAASISSTYSLYVSAGYMMSVPERVEPVTPEEVRSIVIYQMNGRELLRVQRSRVKRGEPWKVQARIKGGDGSTATYTSLSGEAQALWEIATMLELGSLER